MAALFSSNDLLRRLRGGPSTAGPSTASPSTAGPSAAGPGTAGPSTAGPSTAALGAAGGGPARANTPGFAEDCAIIVWLSGDGAGGASSVTDSANSVTDTAARPMPLDATQVFLGEAHLVHKHDAAIGAACAGLREELASLKAALESMENEALYEKARTAVSPFNNIGNAGLFQNRAALKLAELRSLFEPLKTAIEKAGSGGFLDLCGGPGGFTEYLYWLLSADARGPVRGWGVTLASRTGRTGPSCDYRFPESSAVKRCGTFVQIAGADGGSGDLLSAEVRKEIAETIRAGTNGLGVPVVVADGGVDVDGQWDRQDEVTRRLVASQCAVALKTLARGGVFVCKFFGATSDFIAQLLAVLATVFESVAICKPVQSRPSNSETYMVCCGYAGLPAADAAAALLESVVVHDSNQTVAGFGPSGLLDPDRRFVGRLQAANAVLMRAQIQALHRMRELYHRPRPLNQAAMAAACRAKLCEWGLPTEQFGQRRLGGRGVRESRGGRDDHGVRESRGGRGDRGGRDDRDSRDDYGGRGDRGGRSAFAARGGHGSRGAFAARGGKSADTDANWRQD